MNDNDRLTIIDSLNDVIERNSASIDALPKGADVQPYVNMILTAEAVLDLVENDQPLDHESLVFVSDALEASQEVCADLGLDDAAAEYAQAQATVDALSFPRLRRLLS